MTSGMKHVEQGGIRYERLKGGIHVLSGNLCQSRFCHIEHINSLWCEKPYIFNSVGVQCLCRSTIWKQSALATLQQLKYTHQLPHKISVNPLSYVHIQWGRLQRGSERGRALWFQIEMDITNNFFALTAWRVKYAFRVHSRWPDCVICFALSKVPAVNLIKCDSVTDRMTDKNAPGGQKRISLQHVM